jgi:hypothetical protein
MGWSLTDLSTAPDIAGNLTGRVTHFPHPGSRGAATFDAVGDLLELLLALSFRIVRVSVLDPCAMVVCLVCCGNDEGTTAPV